MRSSWRSVLSDPYEFIVFLGLGVIVCLPFLFFLGGVIFTAIEGTRTMGISFFGALGGFLSAKVHGPALKEWRVRE